MAESRTSHCICIGNRCRCHPYSSFYWRGSPGFGACTRFEASCAAFAQYLGCFTVGRRKLYTPFNTTSTSMLTHSVDEPSSVFATNGTMRRHPHFRSHRDIWCRRSFRAGACSSYNKARRVCIVWYIYCSNLSHISSPGLFKQSTISWSSRAAGLSWNDIWGGRRLWKIYQLAIVIYEMHSGCLA